MAKRKNAVKRKKPGKTSRIPRVGKQLKSLPKDIQREFTGYRGVTAGWPQLSTSDARAMFAGSMDTVRDGKRVVLARYGYPIAALVSLQDAAVIELLEAPENAQLKARLLRQLAKK